MKIVNIKEKNIHILSFERHQEFQWHFQESVTYDDIKSHKKAGLHPLLEKVIFGKTTRVDSDCPQPV